jgi:hypothetical protein
MAMYDKTKFAFSETFNNKDGKTSGSGFIGVIMGLTCVAAFIAGVVGWYLGNTQIIEYFDKVLQLGGLSALLMGVRKAAGIFMGKKVEEEEEKPKPKTGTTDENKG